MKYISFLEVFESMRGNSNRFFSDTTLRESVYTWYDADVSFSNRKSQLEKIDSYCQEFVTHLYMIFFPAPGNQRTVEHNKIDIYNSWFNPMTSTLSKLGLETPVLKFKVDDRFGKKLKSDLINNHQYPKSTIIDVKKLDYIWDSFKVGWGDLLIMVKHKKWEKIPLDRYLKIYDYVNKKLKEY